MKEYKTNTAAHSPPVPAAVWCACDSCGKHAALTTGETLALCSSCLMEDVRHRAVESHLYAAAVPVLRAWASNWAAAGVPVADMLEMLEQLTGCWMNEDARERYQRVLLTRLSRAPLPKVEKAPPARVELDPCNLPRLTGAFTETETGFIWFNSADVNGTPSPTPFTLPRGLDALLIATDSPAAAAVLHFANMPAVWSDADAYTVPAGLLPMVRAALGFAAGAGAGAGEAA